MENKEYMSTTELAKILGVSRITVYKRIKKGDIKAEQIGKNFAIAKKEVKRLIGDIVGHPLNNEEKANIDNIVGRTVREYGEVLKLLGKE
ncbi:MAG: helix-turn-helix domain-containing protein [Candidatus Omnitrophota bacterium]